MSPEARKWWSHANAKRATSPFIRRLRQHVTSAGYRCEPYPAQGRLRDSVRSGDSIVERYESVALLKCTCCFSATARHCVGASGNPASDLQAVAGSLSASMGGRRADRRVAAEPIPWPNPTPRARNAHRHLLPRQAGTPYRYSGVSDGTQQLCGSAQISHLSKWRSSCLLPRRLGLEQVDALHFSLDKSIPCPSQLCTASGPQSRCFHPKVRKGELSPCTSRF